MCVSILISLTFVICSVEGHPLVLGSDVERGAVSATVSTTVLLPFGSAKLTA